MTNVNIFEQGKPVTGKFFTFVKVGDEIQGTYIGKIMVKNDKFRRDCYNYEVLDDGGNMWIVPGKADGADPETKQVFDRTMRTIAPGQIVGFRFEKEVDTGKGNMLKQIDIWADPKVVNEEWLNQQEAHKASEEMDGQEMPLPSDSTSNDTVGGQTLSFDSKENDAVLKAASPPDEPTEAPANPSEDKITEIQTLAMEKLGVTDAEGVRDAVMEATGLAFLPANLDKIIEILKATE